MFNQEKKLLCDKFKYSHYLFAIQCMDNHGEKFSKLVRRIWCYIKKKNFYMISLSILITCLLYSVWILWEEVTLQSLLEVKD